MGVNLVVDWKWYRVIEKLDMVIVKINKRLRLFIFMVIKFVNDRKYDGMFELGYVKG